MDAIEYLEQIKHFLELVGENPFKIRAFERAAHTLAGRDDLKARAKAGTLTEIEGVGKGISEVLTEFLLHGKTTALEELKKQISPALIELTQIKGLGAKKAKVIIDELGIQTIGELEYACRENRLTALSGFGEKAQAKILEAIEFYNSQKGQMRIDAALELAETVRAELEKAFPSARVLETGPLRRRLEVLEALDFLVSAPAAKVKALEAKAASAVAKFKKQHGEKIALKLHFTDTDSEAEVLWETTGSRAHIEDVKALLKSKGRAVSEEAIYTRAGLPVIAPEMRETGEEVALSKPALQSTLDLTSVQGVFHVHTTASDGVGTLEEMVAKAHALKFKYIGISDHSQSAFYAQGLKADRLKTQEKEIRKLQEKYPDIRIFWGIESDILQDGALDYDAGVLKKFDFVIASVHSRFQMDKKTMTARIVKAIRNPQTRFLGHMTGRLLLGRKGYELDTEEVIAEAAKHDVAIEINANPQRLDIDWRWGGELRKRECLVSINPDAHSPAGLEDTAFGITVARKALLPKSQVVNTRSVKDIEKWLKRG